MSKPIISIIVPIYNVEKYLNQCLSSIYQISEKRIEVILVDDGSTDSSLSIIRKYESLYPSITKVLTQLRSSVSAARNKGIASATGEWLGFVDSDDFIDPVAFNNVLKMINNSQADVISFDGYRYIDTSQKLLELYQSKRPFTDVQSVDGLTYIETYISKSMTNIVTIWDKIYRKSMIDRINVSFIEGILHEDVAYTFTVFLGNIKVTHVQEKVIYYRQREGSIMYTPSVHKLDSKIKVTEYLLFLFDEKNINDIVLNDYLVFTLKEIMRAGHYIPSDLLKNVSDKKLSLKKRVILAIVKLLNFKNK